MPQLPLRYSCVRLYAAIFYFAALHKRISAGILHARIKVFATWLIKKSNLMRLLRQFAIARGFLPLNWRSSATSTYFLLKTNQSVYNATHKKRESSFGLSICNFNGITVYNRKL
jgi:hypothetical protein